MSEKAEKKKEEKLAEPVNEVNEMELDETELVLAAGLKSKDPHCHRVTTQLQLKILLLLLLLLLLN